MALMGRHPINLLCPIESEFFWDVLSSQRAKRAGWPGTFQPFGPVGALWRRLLHRNGTFVPPAPPTQTRRQVKTDFRRKMGRSGPFVINPDDSKG